MPETPDYADSLREALLALSLIPIAGLQTATYWLKESLERTSKLADDVVAVTALGRSAGLASSTAEHKDADDATLDVIARDLVGSARIYVRSMVRLPADSALYFTGELERRLDALLQQIRPDAATDLEAFVYDDLGRVLDELDRLSVVARAETGSEAKKRAPNRASRYGELVQAVDSLRDRARSAREGLTPRRIEPNIEDPREAPTRALAVAKARVRLEAALREAKELLASARPGHELTDPRAARTTAAALRRAVETLETVIRDIETYAATGPHGGEV